MVLLPDTTHVGTEGCFSLAETQKNVVAEDKVSELSEEDVAVSYIGDELDLKTVGDIIAIIEEKVQPAAALVFV